MNNWPRMSKVGRAAVGAALLAGATACVPGRGAEAPTQQSILDAAGLRGLMWPKGAEQRWMPASEDELRSLEDLVSTLLRRAAAGELGARAWARAQQQAAALGLELRAIEIVGQDATGEGSGSVIRAWLLRERGPIRRGMGAYLIRRGPLPGRGDELLLEAPHVFFDQHTGSLALAVFLADRADGPEGPRGARALFGNSVHRYRRDDGSKRKDPGGDNPADAAHAEEHPLARVSARVLRRRGQQLVQLHGFAREVDDPAIIISSGTDEPSRASAATQRRLQAALPGLAIAHYGVDIDRLGATRNIQGRAARAARRCFVHIELADDLRERLRTEPGLRARFAAAVLEASEDEGARGCR